MPYRIVLFDIKTALMKENQGQNIYMSLFGATYILHLKADYLLILILLSEIQAFMRHSMGIMKSILKGIRNIFSKAGTTGKEYRHIRKNYRKNRILTKLMQFQEPPGHTISLKPR